MLGLRSAWNGQQIMLLRFGLKAIGFCGLSGSDIQLYDFK